MGKTIRWLKGLFGIRKENNHKESEGNDKNGSKNIGHSGRSVAAAATTTATRLCHNPTTIPPNITPAEAKWLSSFYGESDKEQSKHAIAVAAATAAAADAAVAAAQAAVAVVRLTSQTRGSTTMFHGREKWAVTKIQTVFRGFLARKALRALKGLVKLQALVRGYLVRKQATATLHSMQALMRAQASVRAQKTRGGSFNINDQNCHPQFHSRKSVERFDESRSECTMQMHSRRLSSSFEANNNINASEESAKIVEMDTGRPKSRSRRTNTWVSDSCNDSFEQMPSWASDGRNNKDSDNWCPAGDNESCKYSTAQSTPRFANSCGCNTTPITPAKSVCVESYFRTNYGNNYPNYMAKTQSFKAKLRSQSAPKQRPEPVGPRKKMSLNEMMESRASLSGVKMQRSCSQAQDVINFKNCVMGKLGNSTEFKRVQEGERDYSKW